MRQPLWAVSSSLLLLFLMGQVVFFIIKTPIPRRISLEPGATAQVEKKINTVVDLKNIYAENDLFETYIYTPQATIKPIEMEIAAIPEAPAIIPLVIPVETPKVFIAPLPVVLKGVVYLHDRPEQSIAMIQFQDSKEEINYHVGQLINDAQILKIFPNRVIVVRSNGQQETLYLRENEASRDLSAETSKELSNLTITLKDGVYQIPITKFTKYVKGLGQFIDLLDLTTVYKKGKSIGCRVGKASKDSLGAKLGLLYDDIIEQIDELPVTDIASRVLVYNHIVEKKAGDVISVKVERSDKHITLKYMLIQNIEETLHAAAVKAEVAGSKESVVNEQAVYNLEEQRQKILEKKVKMAPTAHQLEMQEKRKAFYARNRNMISQHQGHAQSGVRG